MRVGRDCMPAAGRIIAAQEGRRDRQDPLPLPHREAPRGGRDGRGLSRPRSRARQGRGGQGPRVLADRRGARAPLPRGAGLRAPAAPGDRDVLRVRRIGGRGLPRDGVRRGRDSARPAAARRSAVSPGALGGRVAPRGARPCARGRRPAPGHQAGKRHGHRRPPRQAARLRDRAAARRGGSRRQRGENGSRVDRGRRRHRHARLHVARAAPRQAARRAIGPLLARRRLLRDDRGAPGVSRRQPRRAHRREPVGRVRAARRGGRARGGGGGAGPRDGARPGAAIPLRRGLSRGPARARLGRARGLAAGHAGDRRLPKPLAQSR